MLEEIELSIVILCYRSEESIIDFSKRVKDLALGLTPNFEIILVGNYVLGSDDRTKDIVEQIANQDNVFKAVCKPKEGMMGWDMRTGLEIATGKYICVIDGDGQFPIEGISDCFQLIKTGNYELVKTYREQRNDGLYRKVISKVYNLIFSILFPDLDSKDVNSKPKVFTKSLYDKMNLTSDDWFIDAEIMINVGRMKAKYYEIPTKFYELHGRVSFVKISAILEFLRNLIVFRLKKK